jgi:hypothetical protein
MRETNRATEGTREGLPRVAPAGELAGLAQALSRAIALATVVWCLGVLARAGETACRLATHGTQAPEGEPATSVAASGSPGTIALGRAFSSAAELLLTPSLVAAGALAGLALASFLIIIRGRSVRAGATTLALAAFAGFALAGSETRALLSVVEPSWIGVVSRGAIAVASAVLAWRWIEDVALAAALVPLVDPHAIDAELDREAAAAASRGLDGRDAASRRLDRALGGVPGVGRIERLVEAEEPHLHGQGSPIPRFMPEDDAVAPSGSTRAA